MGIRLSTKRRVMVCESLGGRERTVLTLGGGAVWPGSYA